MELETGGLRSCRRCLLREMTDQEDLFLALRERIENMDPDIRTEKSRYEERLGLCRECEMLMQGMCRKCGCYVELRAAVAKNTCPWGKWNG